MRLPSLLLLLLLAALPVAAQPYLYVGRETTGLIDRVNEAGGGATREAQFVAPPSDLAFDGTYLYASSVPGNEIARIDTRAPSSSNVENLWVTGASGGDIAGVTTDNAFLYWTDRTNRTITRMPLDKSSAPVVIATLPANASIYHITADATYLYWADAGRDAIGRMRKDGAGAVQASWVSGLNDPTGVTTAGIVRLLDQPNREQQPHRPRRQGRDDELRQGVGSDERVVHPVRHYGNADQPVLAAARDGWRTSPRRRAAIHPHRYAARQLVRRGRHKLGRSARHHRHDEHGRQPARRTDGVLGHARRRVGSARLDDGERDQQRWFPRGAPRAKRGRLRRHRLCARRWDDARSAVVYVQRVRPRARRPPLSPAPSRSRRRAHVLACRRTRGRARRGCAADRLPNPARDAARIAVQVARAQHVDVSVYDLLGRRVASVFSGPMEAGEAASVALGAAQLPSGIYSVVATGETFRTTQSFTVAR